MQITTYLDTAATGILSKATLEAGRNYDDLLTTSPSAAFYSFLENDYADMKSNDDKDDSASKFDETVKRLQPWVENLETDAKYAALNIERQMRTGRYGLGLKQINQLLNKEGGVKEKDMIKPLSRSDLLKKRAEIFESLGYSVLVEYDKRARVVACPKNYLSF